MKRFRSGSGFVLTLPLGLSLLGCAYDTSSGKEDLGQSAEAITAPNDGVVSLLDDLTVATTRFNVPYAGMAKAEFPSGLPLSVGSGLRFKRRGPGISFYGLTDRGPNGDSPSYLDAQGVTHPAKAFLVPGFAPQILNLSVLPFVGAAVTSTLPIKSHGVKVSGLAPAGVTSEVSLNENLEALPGSSAGLDPEGIDVDAHGDLWICDEYGPFIVKVDARTGEIIKQIGPGTGLPSVLASRQINRGFEGIAVAPGGKVYAVVQSTLDVAGSTKGKAQFIRLVEYDPETGVTRMLAYPHDIAVYAKSSDAKLGDLVAVDDEHLLVIEQGKDKNKNLRNLVYALDISQATDLSGVTLTGGANAGKELEYGTAAEIAAQITMVKKSVVVDLRAYGFSDEKSEGLSLVDDKTLVVANDQDFGGSSIMAGDPTSTDATAYVVDSTGALTINGVPSSGSFEIHAAAAAAQRSHLFVVRLTHPVSDSFPL